ncbi:hypothetical protein F4775DRAFT_568117 [Biscogniauxia sp. FL1348]|nr:hypothetical protein F4775DRAFT_568117 [Biscogniauxia sp. FL1348]
MSSPASRRLPTRVTKACRRCRRNKSRVRVPPFLLFFPLYPPFSPLFKRPLL